MKFAHIADTHIKNLKYHYEYKKVFEQLYKKLRKEKVDYIVHCGDIAHTKTQISPEFVEMCTDFFRSLATIAPTYIILGNHDGNLKNSSRQDALTPIADALAHPNLHLLKNSGETPLDDKFTLNVLSVFDEDNWTDPTDSDKINIALYHGSISGCKTDVGWTMEYGENDVSIFDNFDYAFLGDIHKTDQVLDEEGRIRYCGSTVQQNHGETNDKGFLVWDIKSKDKYKVKHHILLNPKPFVTINLTPKGRVPKGTTIPEGSRLRLVSSNNLPVHKLRRAMDVVKSRFKPEAVTYLNRSAGERGSVENIPGGLVKENLRDITVQEEFIEEYLQDYEAEQDVLNKVFELNRRYNTIAEENEEVSRNINWKMRKFEWDNVFNYGEDNSIDFSNLNGIVGIFGKNFSGKSSIIDSMLYTLYNSTSKNERKNLNVINQNTEDCIGRVDIEIGDELYTIERKSEKYTKRLKGEETLEAKTFVEFNSQNEVTGETSIHNGLTRSETDKNIRRVMGTLDDFLLTSMSSQLGSLSFINEGSTKRKEILAKFLDLEIFEKKFKFAKEDVSDIKGALKRLEGREFDDEIVIASRELKKNSERTTEQKLRCERLKKEIKKTENKIGILNDKIDSIPAKIIDIFEVKNLKKLKEEESFLLQNENRRLKLECEEKGSLYEKISDFVGSFDIDDLQQKRETVAEKSRELEQIGSELRLEGNKHESNKKKVGLLSEVPCGEEYSHCKFISDAYSAKKRISQLENKLLVLNNSQKEAREGIRLLQPEILDQQLMKYEQILDKKNELANEITQNELKTEKNLSKIAHIGIEVDNLGDKISEYEKNRQVIENLEGLMSTKSKFEQKVGSQREELDDCEEDTLHLYKEHGSLEQKLHSLQEQKQELVDLRQEYAAYDLFQRAMHSNGIAYDIIKKKLPAINDEVSKVLANVVDFDVFFENDGNKLDIFIKHPKYDARPIEMGSGAEKTIAAMAIRLALLSVSNLPKSNIFILDEPATALDEENMEGFIRILDMVKNYYQVVLLISHVDSLKDIVDMTIDIERRNGFAHVNQ